MLFTTHLFYVKATGEITPYAAKPGHGKRRMIKCFTFSA